MMTFVAIDKRAASFNLELGRCRYFRSLSVFGIWKYRDIGSVSVLPTQAYFKHSLLSFDVDVCMYVADWLVSSVVCPRLIFLKLTERGLFPIGRL